MSRWSVAIRLDHAGHEVQGTIRVLAIGPVSALALARVDAEHAAHVAGMELLEVGWPMRIARCAA